MRAKAPASVVRLGRLGAIYASALMEYSAAELVELVSIYLHLLWASSWCVSLAWFAWGGVPLPLPALGCRTCDRSLLFATEARRLWCMFRPDQSINATREAHPHLPFTSARLLRVLAADQELGAPLAVPVPLPSLQFPVPFP